MNWASGQEVHSPSIGMSPNHLVTFKDGIFIPHGVDGGGEKPQPESGCPLVSLRLASAPAFDASLTSHLADSLADWAYTIIVMLATQLFADRANTIAVVVAAQPLADRTNAMTIVVAPELKIAHRQKLTMEIQFHPKLRKGK